jgi:hypothetical protein
VQTPVSPGHRYQDGDIIPKLESPPLQAGIRNQRKAISTEFVPGMFHNSVSMISIPFCSHGFLGLKTAENHKI